VDNPLQVIEERSPGELYQEQLQQIRDGRRRTDTRRLELALEALKQLAEMCRRHESDYSQLSGMSRLADRQAREWEGLYDKQLRANSAMSDELGPKATEVGQLHIEVGELKEQLGRVGRQYGGMMQDRENIYNDLQQAESRVTELMQQVLRLNTIIAEGRMDDE
jgi:chromosome segregation ATPase